MRRGGRWERGFRGRTYVYPWLIHVDVWQKPTQYCKAIILQLKINIILKNTWIVLPFPHYLPNAVASQRDKALNNAAKSLQSCLTLCDPMDCSPPGSSVHGILQARTLEWVAIPFSRGSSQPRDRTQISFSSCTASRFFTTEPLGCGC